MMNEAGMQVGTILLIEDNVDVNDVNRRALELDGHRVEIATTLAQARERIGSLAPDVILLDVVMPDGDGIEFCKEIRNNTNAYIIFLTAKDSTKDLLEGLRQGGDDYITKPYPIDELQARIEAAMRRRHASFNGSQVLDGFTVGGLSLNPIARRAYWQGVEISLRTKEFDILWLLATTTPSFATSSEIYSRVWGTSAFDTSTVRQHIYRLRSGLGQAGAACTVEHDRAKGYRLAF
jgi:DNA-binding response OmpR family regulator